MTGLVVGLAVGVAVVVTVLVALAVGFFAGRGYELRRLQLEQEAEVASAFPEFQAPPPRSPRGSQLRIVNRPRSRRRGVDSQR